MAQEIKYIGIKCLADNASIPKRAHADDAGFDLTSTIDTTLKPFERQAIPCGVAIELPLGFAALVVPRSGLALKRGISIVNAPGLIDSGYRGEINAVLINMDSTEDFEIKKGDRIAQLVIIKLPEIEFCEKDELDITSRNQSGFGSTGV